MNIDKLFPLLHLEILAIFCANHYYAYISESVEAIQLKLHTYIEDHYEGTDATVP